METRQKLTPGSYAIIKWSSLESEQVCKILGYRRDMMIVRNNAGKEIAISPKSTHVVGLKEVK